MQGPGTGRLPPAVEARASALVQSLCSQHSCLSPPPHYPCPTHSSRKKKAPLHVYKPIQAVAQAPVSANSVSAGVCYLEVVC